MGRPQHGGNLIWAANIAGCPTSSLLDFSASINPYGISPKVLNAITEGIAQLKHYPSPDYADLRACLGKYHRLSPDYILPGNGSAELLTWAARDLAQREATYLVTPAFGDYDRALAAFKANIVRLESTLPLKDLASILGNHPTSKRGLLLNNPHNPTGKLWDKPEIVDYLDQFALVVVDEAFMDFLPEAQQQSLIGLIADYPNLIILRSLTKFYSLPGLRIGYAIAHTDRLQRWQKYRDPWSVNSLAVVAAIAAVQDQEFQNFTWNWLTPARDNLTRGLGNIPELEPLPSAANFLLVKSSVSVTRLQLQLLKKYQILIRDCLSFAELKDNYFRVAVRTPEENNYLLTSLEDVIKDVRD